LLNKYIPNSKKLNRLILSTVHTHVSPTTCFKCSIIVGLCSIRKFVVGHRLFVSIYVFFYFCSFFYRFAMFLWSCILACFCWWKTFLFIYNLYLVYQSHKLLLFINFFSFHAKRERNFCSVLHHFVLSYMLPMWAILCILRFKWTCAFIVANSLQNRIKIQIL
jgi:hypothetical protein